MMMMLMMIAYIKLYKEYNNTLAFQVNTWNAQCIIRLLTPLLRFANSFLYIVYVLFLHIHFLCAHCYKTVCNFMLLYTPVLMYTMAAVSAVFEPCCPACS